MRPRITVVVLASLAMLLAGASPARAQCQTSTAIVVPIQIVVPGCYTLADTITTAPGPGPHIGIEISVSDVYLDLSGYAINAMTLTSPGIQVDPGLRNITIRNGAINGGSRAIAVLPGATNLVMEDLQIFSPASEAIFVDEALNVIFRRNEVYGGAGVWIGNPVSHLHSAIIEDNLLQDAGGIRVAAGIGIAVRGNRVYSNASAVVNDGISIEGSESFEVVGNTVATVLNGNGINVVNSTDGRIVDNVVRGANGHGISLAASDNCYLLDNVSGGNVLTGMRIEGMYNRAQQNLLNLNGQSGLWFEDTSGISQGNTYGGNSVTSGGTLPAACANSVCDPAAICVDGPTNLSFGDNVDGTGPC